MALVFDDKALGFCFSLWVVQCRLLRGGFDVGLVADLGQWMWPVAFGFRYVLFWMEWLDSWSGLVGFGCWFLLLFLCFCWVCLFGFCVPRFWWVGFAFACGLWFGLWVVFGIS